MNPNDPAFSDKINTDRDPDQMGDRVLSGGLTKREFFAALALSSIVGREHHFYLYANGEVQEENSPEGYSRLAVYCADALIAELSK